MGDDGEPEKPADGSPTGNRATPWLAALACLLLVDAAIETFVSGSPVRWWVAAVVVVTLASITALWQRTSWAQRAAGSGSGSRPEPG
jgi:hypothetical protein